MSVSEQSQLSALIISLKSQSVVCEYVAKAESEARILYKSNLTLDYVRKQLVAPLKAELGTLLTDRREGDHLVMRKRDEIRKMEELIERNSGESEMNLKAFEGILSSTAYDEALRLQRERRFPLERSWLLSPRLAAKGYIASRRKWMKKVKNLIFYVATLGKLMS